MENLLTAAISEETLATAGGRPAGVPEKFWDGESIRVDALLKSYLELERKLSTAPKAPEIPDGPDGYCIACDHGLFDPDPEVNTRLHGAGFSSEQAQLVYDLAAERLVPMIMDLAAEFQADRELERLVAHFGGAEKWREVSRQLFAWGRKQLPPDALAGLSASYDGVMALYRMMQGNEPSPMKSADAVAGAPGEPELRSLMRDPKYWRDKDPATVAKVTEGFRRLYPGGR